MILNGETINVLFSHSFYADLQADTSTPPWRQWFAVWIIRGGSTAITNRISACQFWCHIATRNHPFCVSFTTRNFDI